MYLQEYAETKPVVIVERKEVIKRVLGYLSERSKGEGIPEERMICEKTIECMLFKLARVTRFIPFSELASINYLVYR